MWPTCSPNEPDAPGYLTDRVTVIVSLLTSDITTSRLSQRSDQVCPITTAQSAYIDAQLYSTSTSTSSPDFYLTDADTVTEPDLGLRKWAFCVLTVSGRGPTTSYVGFLLSQCPSWWRSSKAIWNFPLMHLIGGRSCYWCCFRTYIHIYPIPRHGAHSVHVVKTRSNLPFHSYKNRLDQHWDKNSYITISQKLLKCCHNCIIFIDVDSGVEDQ